MNRPTTRARVVVCTLLAMLAGDYARSQLWHRPVHPDFSQVWFAARAVLHGQDPYALIGPGRAFQWPAPLFYPLPAALLGLPLAPFSEPTAVFLFVAIGIAGLVWALTRESWAGLWAMTSLCVQHAALIAQWSPLLAGAVALAPLSVVLVAKPTVGAAVFAARPSWRPLVAGMVLVALAFVVQPHWFIAWRHALESASVGAGRFPYRAPALLPGGFLALAALTRWRRPEARLLAVLACVPHTTLPYEGVLLFLVPQGWRQMVFLSASSWAMTAFVHQVMQPANLTESVLAYGPAMVAFLYLPCTLMVLRRPNEGTVLSPQFLRWLTALHHRWIFERRTRVLSAHLAELIPSSATTVLDVGCGDGTLAHQIMQRRPELTITGLEVQARPTTAIPVAEFGGETIPLPDQSVDVVLFVDVLHHAHAIQPLLYEAHRVARQAVIVKDHTSDPWLGYLRLWWMDWAGNVGHGVSLRTLYGKRAWWDQSFHFANLTRTEERTQLGLYPWPLRWLCESGLHFISRFERA